LKPKAQKFISKIFFSQGIFSQIKSWLFTLNIVFSGTEFNKLQEWQT
jgi:hypothetical protein